MNFQSFNLKLFNQAWFKQFQTCRKYQIIFIFNFFSKYLHNNVRLMYYEQIKGGKSLVQSIGQRMRCSSIFLKIFDNDLVKLILLGT